MLLLSKKIGSFKLLLKHGAEHLGLFVKRFFVTESSVISIKFYAFIKK
jgi:hypothetical protein